VKYRTSIEWNKRVGAVVMHYVLFAIIYCPCDQNKHNASLERLVFVVTSRATPVYFHYVYYIYVQVLYIYT